MLRSTLAIWILLAGAASGQQKTLTPQEYGDIFIARKMFREAIEKYKEAAEKAPAKDRSILEDKIGIAWHQLGDLNLAMKAYQRSAKLDPTYSDAINNMGTVYYAEKRYGRAVSRYRRALELTPDSAAVWSNLGTALYEQKKFPEMAEAYAKALELDPTVFDARNGPGTQMQDRAVQDKARYHFELAKVYAKTGKNEIALQYLRKALEEGFRDKEKLVKEPEFAALKETDEFKDLLTLEPRVL